MKIVPIVPIMVPISLVGTVLPIRFTISSVGQRFQVNVSTAFDADLIITLGFFSFSSEEKCTCNEQRA
jgi:hypothetical protein